MCNRFVCAVVCMAALPLLAPAEWKPINDYVLNPLDRRNGDEFTGKMVASVEEWEAYRPTLIKHAAENAYGKAPEPGTYTQEHAIIDSKALEKGITRKTVKIKVTGPNGAHDWNVKVWLPKSKDPVNVILFTDHRNKSWGDNASSSYFDKDLILSRGYGVAFYSVHGTAPGGGRGESRETYKKGLHNKFNLNGKNDWGLIATWAFGGLRVVDALADEKLFPEISKIGVAGHSRSGHTAEWMAAQDTRISYCILNGSTDLFAFTGDPAKDKQDLGWKAFWYCRHFSNYYKDEWPSIPWPEDGNIGIALIAPRLVAAGTGRDDKLVGGKYLPSEYYAVVYSQPVWNLYGQQDPSIWNPTEVWTSDEYSRKAPIVRRNGNLHYHMANHGHGMETWDWKQYLDFADERWR